MKDISKKIRTSRIARAEAVLTLRPEMVNTLREGKVPEGDPLPVARVAAIQAAKNTSQLIPYCHPISIDYVECSFEIEDSSIRVLTEVKAVHSTGVEMEALTAATVGALTLCDMLKPLDTSMEISKIRLTEKRGGESDLADSRDRGLRAAVLVMSDPV